MSASVLVLHSPGDQVVGVDNARQIFEAARHPKSFVALDGADHLLSDRADADFAAGVIAAWSRRYLPDPPQEVSAPTGASPHSDVPVEAVAADGVLVRELDADRYAHAAGPGGIPGSWTSPPPSGERTAGPTPTR